MKTFLIILTALLTANAFSQSDSVRPCAFISSYSEIKDKETRKEVMSFSEEAAMADKTTTLKLKMFRITQSFVTKYNNGMSVFQKDSIKIVIRSEVFDPKKHKLKFHKEQNYVDLKSIDGKHFYGTDGSVPRTGIGKIFMCFGKDTLSFDKNLYSDLYEPNMGTYKSAGGESNIYHHAYISKNKKRIYLQMLNSDASGSYEVIWIIEGKKIAYRLINHSC